MTFCLLAIIAQCYINLGNSQLKRFPEQHNGRRDPKEARPTIPSPLLNNDTGYKWVIFGPPGSVLRALDTQAVWPTPPFNWQASALDGWASNVHAHTIDDRDHLVGQLTRCMCTLDWVKKVTNQRRERQGNSRSRMGPQKYLFPEKVPSKVATRFRQEFCVANFISREIGGEMHQN